MNEHLISQQNVFLIAITSVKCRIPSSFRLYSLVVPLVFPRRSARIISSFRSYHLVVPLVSSRRSARILLSFRSHSRVVPP